MPPSTLPWLQIPMSPSMTSSRHKLLSSSLALKLLRSVAVLLILCSQTLSLCSQTLLWLFLSNCSPLLFCCCPPFLCSQTALLSCHFGLSSAQTALLLSCCCPSDFSSLFFQSAPNKPLLHYPFWNRIASSLTFLISVTQGSGVSGVGFRDSGFSGLGIRALGV